MSGFTGTDGSELVGGLNPSGQAQAISLDGGGLVKANLYNNGVLNSSSNPLWITPQGVITTQDQIRAYTIAGQAFSATTTKNQAPGAATLGFQVLNPANSGKNLLIYSLILNIASATFHDLRMTTADVSSIAGWSNVAITPVNNKGGGPASVATAGYSNVNLTGGLLGSARETIAVPGTQSLEALSNGECIYLPASASINGIALYINATGTNNWSVTVEYLEF